MYANHAKSKIGNRGKHCGETGETPKEPEKHEETPGET